MHLSRMMRDFLDARIKAYETRNASDLKTYLDAKFADTAAQLTRIETAVNSIIRAEEAQAKENVMARAEVQAVINDLKSELTRNTDAVAANRTAMQALLQAVEDAKDDPTELQAVLDGWKQNTDSIINAAVKNTPADPAAGGAVNK